MTESQDLAAVAAAASAAAGPFADASPADRARALVAVADALDAAADELVSIAMRETGLGEPRLRGELTRTSVQLRLFAETVLDGTYLDVRIDDADPDFVLGARAEVRRMLVPVGPVVNFAASNFPFAFSVAGGDTASALAAGCPVVLKAHPGHPELSRATAATVRDALAAAGLPDGVFQLVEGVEAGVAILQDPRIRAASFTGSLRAGRHLADLAAARPSPIPFYGELGSVNPVFVTRAAIDERAAELAAGYVASVSGSAGQLCTKPGVVFVPAGAEAADRLVARVAEAAAGLAEHRLLNPGITRGFAARRGEVLGAPGVVAVAEGALRVDADEQGWATPTILRVSLDDFRASREQLAEEAFGPLSILVEVPDGADLADLVDEFLEGELTATVHLGADEASGAEHDASRALVRALADRVGRVLVGGWPTGVAVTPAMQHGGPWPATTDAGGSTSVGTAAISRFLRPVAYQSVPDALLPPALQDANPWNVPQRRSPAGQSRGWGATAAAAIA
ncbi:aldehyde dehydrogenase family protein [Agromyces sp. CFH 90414]|uniref:Aldehyde dehydrogenase family protein n=1 Tax=Agromyces agglutinans TaxID=2662258 RepID=A0A6I2F425_9MICO|nr:aldehyde dehydrogenase (NADP(+)) [Agromyces agglutinans]MRG59329.1 aldehyde dehydrogenase family protein [Agromyces agglutinans]